MPEAYPRLSPVSATGQGFPTLRWSCSAAAWAAICHCSNCAWPASDRLAHPPRQWLPTGYKSPALHHGREVPQISSEGHQVFSQVFHCSHCCHGYSCRCHLRHGFKVFHGNSVDPDCWDTGQNFSPVSSHPEETGFFGSFIFPDIAKDVTPETEWNFFAGH